MSKAKINPTKDDYEIDKTASSFGVKFFEKPSSQSTKTDFKVKDLKNYAIT